MAAGEVSIARRYATALFRVARDNGEVDAVAANLSEVSTAAHASPELMTVLHHPRITRTRKQELLQSVFQGNIRPDVERFLLLLVEKDRASLIPNIGEEFKRLVDEYNRVTDAEAVTAVAMDEAQIAALKAKLEATTGYKVRLQTRVDASILGGMVVRVGDRMIDGSVATQLQSLRDKLQRVRVGA